MHIHAPDMQHTPRRSNRIHHAFTALAFIIGFGSLIHATNVSAADTGSVGVEQSPINISLKGLRQR
jgi:hypothetical protein